MRNYESQAFRYDALVDTLGEERMMVASEKALQAAIGASLIQCPEFIEDHINDALAELPDELRRAMSQNLAEYLNMGKPRAGSVLNAHHVISCISMAMVHFADGYAVKHWEFWLQDAISYMKGGIDNASESTH